MRPGSKRDQHRKAGSQRQTGAWLGLLIIPAGILVYANSFAGLFIFDDAEHILNNEAIHQLWPIWDLLGHRDRPIINLSLAVNYALDELNVWGYHAVNLAVHLLAGLTLFGIVRRTLLRERFGVTTRQAAPWLALSAALLWVVHPLQTQSVTYVIQRSESMMGLFYLLTLYCVIRGADSRRALGWYAAAIAACALGMGSKAVMVTAPVLVLLYDRVFLSPSWRQAFRRRWGLYLGLGATWTVVALCGVVQGVFNPPADADATVGFGYKGVTPLEYAATQPGVVLHYLRLSLWPHPLCLDYAWPVAKTLAAVVLPGMVVLALVVATGFAFWRRAGLGFLGAWFFVNLAPTSSIIPIKDIAFEHRMYLPLAAVVVLVVLAGWWGLRRLFGGRRLPGALAAAAVIVPAVLLGYGTVQRNRDYHSKVVMWNKVVAQNPQNHRAHYNLAIALFDRGRVEEAIEHHAASLRLLPTQPRAHANLATALVKCGRIEEAIEHCHQALRLKPDYPKVHNNLANALVKCGRVAEAIEHYHQALRLRPDDPKVHNNLAIALSDLQRVEEAIEHYEVALQLLPTQPQTHNNLANALVKCGRTEEAIEHYREALRLEPDYAKVHNNLGNALLKQGRIDEAIEHCTRALRLQPQFSTAHRYLGDGLLQKGRLAQAVEHYSEAVRIDPLSAENHCRLGDALVRQGRLDEGIEAYREALRLDPQHQEAQEALESALTTLGEGEEGVNGNGVPDE